jgi:hypothetical protein
MFTPVNETLKREKIAAPRGGAFRTWSGKRAFQFWFTWQGGGTKGAPQQAEAAI